MAFSAKLYLEARHAERHAVALDGTLRDSQWQPIDVVVRDLSIDGFLAVTTEAPEVGAPIGIGLHGLGSRDAVVVWSTPEACGCQFDRRLTRSELDSALAAVATAPIWYASRFDPGDLEAPTLTDAGFSARGRLAVIIGVTMVSWAALAGMRTLFAGG